MFRSVTLPAFAYSDLVTKSKRDLDQIERRVRWSGARRQAETLNSVAFPTQPVTATPAFTEIEVVTVDPGRWLFLAQVCFSISGAATASVGARLSVGGVPTPTVDDNDSGLVAEIPLVSTAVLTAVTTLVLEGYVMGTGITASRKMSRLLAVPA